MELHKTLKELVCLKDEEALFVLEQAYSDALLTYRKHNPKFYFSIKKGIYWK